MDTSQWVMHVIYAGEDIALGFDGAKPRDLRRFMGLLNRARGEVNADTISLPAGAAASALIMGCQIWGLRCEREDGTLSFRGMRVHEYNADPETSRADILFLRDGTCVAKITGVKIS